MNNACKKKFILIEDLIKFRNEVAVKVQQAVLKACEEDYYEVGNIILFFENRIFDLETELSDCESKEV